MNNDSVSTQCDNTQIYIDPNYKQGEFSEGAQAQFSIANYGEWNGQCWSELVFQATSINLIFTKTGERYLESEPAAVVNSGAIDCCKSRLMFDVIELTLPNNIRIWLDTNTDIASIWNEKES